MIAYSIDYKVRGNDRIYTTSVEAKDIQSAKKKLGKKHGYKDGRMIEIIKSVIVGYF